MAITRTVTVAAGRAAPGHPGELTVVMPFELVDAVLAETRSVQRRLRDLPSRVGILTDAGRYPAAVMVGLTVYRQLSGWAETGLNHKLGPGLYTATA
ncbi:transposase domain-containing protein [Streptomyces sp. DT171]|uniref:transposase domain-containing protein n=1 Tax=Streptomyces sp. DT171 TaxID=3416524 RepID=UPI003CF43288